MASLDSDFTASWDKMSISDSLDPFYWRLTSDQLWESAEFVMKGGVEEAEKNPSPFVGAFYQYGHIKVAYMLVAMSMECLLKAIHFSKKEDPPKGLTFRKDKRGHQLDALARDILGARLPKQHEEHLRALTAMIFLGRYQENIERKDDKVIKKDIAEYGAPKWKPTEIREFLLGEWMHVRGETEDAIGNLRTLAHRLRADRDKSKTATDPSKTISAHSKTAPDQSKTISAHSKTAPDQSKTISDPSKTAPDQSKTISDHSKTTPDK